MAIEAVKVPTDIQVEEKIIGPITLKQVFILVGTGGMSFLIWEGLGARDPIDIPLTIISWMPLAIGAAFSFISINDVSLMRLLLLQIEKLHKASKRTFGPRPGISITIHPNPNAGRKPVHKALEPKEKMEALSSTLDTTFSDLEKDENDTEPLPVRRDRIQASEGGVIRDVRPPQDPPNA